MCFVVVQPLEVMLEVHSHLKRSPAELIGMSPPGRFFAVCPTQLIKNGKLISFLSKYFRVLDPSHVPCTFHVLWSTRPSGRAGPTTRNHDLFKMAILHKCSPSSPFQGPLAAGSVQNRAAQHDTLSYAAGTCMYRIVYAATA